LTPAKKIFFFSKSSFLALDSADTEGFIKIMLLQVYFMVDSAQFGIKKFFVNYQDFKKNRSDFFFLGFGPILRNFEVSLLLGPSIKKTSMQFYALNVVVSAHYKHKFGSWNFSYYF
jgi:hypothetical protein